MKILKKITLIAALAGLGLCSVQASFAHDDGWHHALYQGSEQGLNEEAAAALLNEALNKQRVFVTAPGLPSKLHEMALAAEDPDAPENAQKKYHPAERNGWKNMIAYGEALEKQGVLKIKHGTFFEDDFYNRRFKYTGVLMELKPEMKPYVAVTPVDGRVLLRVGYSGVGRIEGIEKIDAEHYKVKFTTALCRISPWHNAEVDKFTKASSLLGGEESVVVKVKGGKAYIDDEDFLISLKNPVTDFKK